MRVFVDFHHSSLLRSLVLLFENRLGMDVYRPIGMEWFNGGYWAINDQEDTAKQFLEYDSQPADETPPLNNSAPIDRGVYWVADPGNVSHHRACTFEYFINNKFDYIIATIPAHVPLFRELIAKYQPKAKLIVQLGNNWSLDQFAGCNVLASIAPQLTPEMNIYFYHQEFDTEIFKWEPIQQSKLITSYVNVIQASGIGWSDYKELKALLARDGFELKAFGGQCPDGNMNGPLELANMMHASQFILHVKPGGDGFGHIIHNAYACGRPVITRPSHYANQLAEKLLVPGTYIDLDRYGRKEVKNIIRRLTNDPEELARMSRAAAERFMEVVDYKKEAEGVSKWLNTLR